MSGLDKILEHINTDATNTAKDLLAAAQKEADELLAKCKEDAQAAAKAIDDQSKTACDTATKRIASAAEQKEKRMILEAKQKEIDGVLSAALDKVESLDSKEYFATIIKMIGKYAHKGKEGTIAFGKKDLDRLPSDLAAQIKTAADGAKLEIAKEPANIKSGFVLSYGDVEENCSFEALIEASKETLQDKIGQALFG